jgi:hypothetical protein
LPLHELLVPPADVAGSRLRLVLNAPAPEPLATHLIRHDDGSSLLLGVLGASHVISVEHPNAAFSEQVSCTEHPNDGKLPDFFDEPGYRLESCAAEHGVTEFRRIASNLRVRCGRDEEWLGGTFPGDDAALTALCAVPDGHGWRWRTWHLYPSPAGGTVVHTASRWRP